MYFLQNSSQTACHADICSYDELNLSSSISSSKSEFCVTMWRAL